LALARGLHPGERLDRRPFRRAHGVSGGDRRVHARLDRLIGLAGIALATIFIEDVRAETPDPFDPLGAVLAGLGIGGLAFGGSLLGLNFLPTSVVIALIVVGAGAAYAYVLHARRTPAPVLDLSLLEIPTMRAAIVGGFIYRSGIGAMPFLLPLL